MSDNYDYDADDIDNNSGGGLRAQLEKALTDLKSEKKKTATYEARLDEQAASVVFKDFKEPAKVARFAKSEGVSLTDETALTKFLADNSELFVKTEVSADDLDGLVQEPGQEIVEPDANVVATHSILAQLQATATPATKNKFESQMAGLSDDASPAEVLAAMKAAGI